MRLLLLSSGRIQPGKLLDFAFNDIIEFIGRDTREIVFIPFARVLMNWDEYTKQVQNAFSSTKYRITSICKNNDMQGNIERAECILVGGGNTFNLLYILNKYNLTELLKRKIESGTNYISWSAGSNIASPTIKTTNDMPIVELESLKALNLIPYQINPHFTNANVQQTGESRDQRIREFLAVNPDNKVLCLRNSSYIEVTGNKILIHGSAKVRLYEYGTYEEIKPGSVIPFKPKC